MHGAQWTGDAGKADRDVRGENVALVVERLSTLVPALLRTRSLAVFMASDSPEATATVKAYLETTFHLPLLQTQGAPRHNVNNKVRREAAASREETSRYSRYRCQTRIDR